MLHKCQEHLNSVKENYFQHFCFAVSLGIRMIVGGLAAILHGIFPAIFQYTGSKTLKKLNEEVIRRLLEKCPDKS